MESYLLTRRSGYLGGEWRPAASGRTLPVHNPATGEHLADVPSMSPEDAAEAIEAAAKSLSRPASISQRARWLARLAEQIVEHREELGRIITEEHGKPLKEAVVEAEYAASFFRYYSRGVTHLGSQVLEERPRGLEWAVHFRPAGVAGLITPWNFPLAMLAKKFAAALAADCACVVKPSSKTPLSAIAFFGLLDSLDLPPGKANLILGPPDPLGRILCEHPRTRVISFTGSTQVGRDLMTIAAPHLKRMSMELGGNAPMIVFEDADLELAGRQLVLNKFRASGQTCVCVNRVYVHDSVRDAFLDIVVPLVKQLRVSHGMDPESDLGPLIDRQAFGKVTAHLHDALARGGEAIFFDNRWTKAARESTANFGCYFPPTIVIGACPEMTCVREETFGPLIPILTFHAEEDALEAANATEYGLAAYLFSRDDSRRERLLPRLRFGHIGWNTCSGPTAEAPFGGFKMSGFGREGGLEGLYEFAETQTVPRGA